MAQPSGPAPGAVNSGGGSVIGGGVNTGGAPFVGRDQIANYFQIDVEKLIAALRQALPANDPSPQHLLEALQKFQSLHRQLFEWKELHNCLNEVVIDMDQFAREVERLDATGRSGDARQLARQWRPVAGKVDILLAWAGTVQTIAPAPFARQPDGSMRGPAWAVEVQAARLRVDEVLTAAGSLNGAQLYDATAAFVDAAARHMYLADKQLRDVAAELYDLSRVVLGQLGHG